MTKEDRELHGHRSELHTGVQHAPTTPAVKRLKVSWNFGKGMRGRGGEGGRERGREEGGEGKEVGR